MVVDMVVDMVVEMLVDMVVDMVDIIDIHNRCDPVTWLKGLCSSLLERMKMEVKLPRMPRLARAAWRTPSISRLGRNIGGIRSG